MSFVGCVLTGIGVGMLLGNTSAWVLIGLGVGFLMEHVIGGLFGRFGSPAKGWRSGSKQSGPGA